MRAKQSRSQARNIAPYLNYLADRARGHLDEPADVIRVRETIATRLEGSYDRLRLGQSSGAHVNLADDSTVDARKAHVRFNRDIRVVGAAPRGLLGFSAKRCVGA